MNARRLVFDVSVGLNLNFDSIKISTFDDENDRRVNGGFTELAMAPETGRTLL